MKIEALTSFPQKATVDTHLWLEAGVPRWPGLIHSH
jgi:hypothetical protein